jgi:hypothetical protein
MRLFQPENGISVAATDPIGVDAAEGLDAFAARSVDLVSNLDDAVAARNDSDMIKKIYWLYSTRLQCFARLYLMV